MKANVCACVLVGVCVYAPWNRYLICKYSLIEKVNYLVREANCVLINRRNLIYSYIDTQYLHEYNVP